MMFSTEKVCDVVSIPYTTFIQWVTRGYVVPAKRGGRGRGNTNRYTLTQVVGIDVAYQLQQSKPGCPLTHLKEVVEAFGNVSEEWLRKKFANKGTHFVGIQEAEDAEPMLPILAPNPKGYDWVNVKEAYERVKEKLAVNA